MESKDIISAFMKKGILSDKSAVDHIIDKGLDVDDVIDRMLEDKKYFASSKVIEKLYNQPSKKESDTEVIRPSKEFYAKDIEGSLKITSEIPENPNTKNLSDFVAYFNDRYEKIKNIIVGRSSVNNVISIARLDENSNESDASIVCMISDIGLSKNGHTILTVEDPTGQMTAIAMKDKDIQGIDNIIPDEIVALRGSVNKGTMFVKSIIYPELPMSNNTEKKVYDPVSAVFISDIHIGSKEYMKKIEDRFIDWLKSGEKGSGNVKYICMAGDNVDGVGIYPGQKDDLSIPDIYDQYAAFERFVERIPEYINIVVIPGNHDAVRLAEPQPKLSKELVPNLRKFNNVSLGTNPCRVNLHSIGDNIGINSLMYHGYSFTKIIDAIPELRAHGMDKPQHVMKELLKKRHLAPKYGSTVLMPSGDDPHVISNVPDIFHTGDLHSFCIDSYRGVLNISSSTFQGQTAFMDRVGHTAQPGKITTVRLDTKKPTVIDMFS